MLEIRAKWDECLVIVAGSIMIPAMSTLFWQAVVRSGLRKQFKSRMLWLPFSMTLVATTLILTLD